MSSTARISHFRFRPQKFSRRQSASFFVVTDAVASSPSKKTDILPTPEHPVPESKVRNSRTKKQRRGFFNRRKRTPAQPKRNYAFIDSQNLNLGVQRAGWKMNWKKFRVFLEEQYDVEKAFMFIGYMPENEDLYTQMQEAGYLVALKPTLDMFAKPDEKDKVPTKGNVDTELVMYVMKEINNYNKAIIISGDGDFYSLIEYLKTKNKLSHVMVPNWRYSTLLKPFEEYIVRLDTLRADLAYRTKNKKQRTQSRKKTTTAKPRRKPTKNKT